MATSRKPLFGADEPTAHEGAALPADGEAPLTAPPAADVVASRALMVGALLERARLESTRDAARFTALKRSKSVV